MALVLFGLTNYHLVGKSLMDFFFNYKLVTNLRRQLIIHEIIKGIPLIYKPLIN